MIDFQQWMDEQNLEWRWVKLLKDLTLWHTSAIHFQLLEGLLISPPKQHWRFWFLCTHWPEANSKLIFPLSWFTVPVSFPAVCFQPAQPTVVLGLRDYRVDPKVWINWALTTFAINKQQSHWQAFASIRLPLSKCPLKHLSPNSCKDGQTKWLFQACLYRQILSRGTWWGEPEVTIEKGLFKNQTWIRVMIVNDLFSCPLSPTVKPQFVLLFFFLCFLFFCRRQGDRRVSTAAAGPVNEPLIWRAVLMSEMPMWWMGPILNRG